MDTLIAERAELLVSDCQLIGSKVIIKGSTVISVCGLSAESGEPVLADFSTPFSQIVDVGIESMSDCMIRPEITGTYFELTDTISGEKVPGCGTACRTAAEMQREYDCPLYNGRLQQSDADRGHLPNTEL
jgi:hypothetical protein